MTNTFNPLDPEYPNRPDHPDFWRLADASLWLDGKSEDDGFDPEELLEDYIDVETFSYVLASRTMAALNRTLSKTEFVCYLEGFMMASRFAELGGKQEKK